METTFLISTLVRQSPRRPTSQTASDILYQVSEILQSDVTIAFFNTQGVGLGRVIDLPMLYFIDDKEQYEAQPNFEINLYHDRVTTRVTPPIDEFEFELHRV